MADKIKLVQGDTGPQIQLTLTDETTGAAIDLSGALVTLHFRALGEATTIFSRVCIVSAPTSGKAVVVWEPGDLNVDPGEYEGEIEIYWAATGIRQTIYELLKFKVRADLA